MDLKQLHKLQDKWVAFSSDRKKVIANSKDLNRLLKTINGKRNLIVSFISQSDVFLSP